jgi:glycosyltransferase involved in cell wall biosynthesis
MKTLHLPSAYVPWVTGGTEIFCHRLCQNLQKLGVETLVSFHQASEKVPLGNYVHEGVRVKVLPPIPDLRERQSLYSRTTRETSSFKQLLDEYQPDIVHFHNFSVSQGITHLRLAKAAGCKVVLTYHTPTVSCSQHGLLYRSQSVCDGYISLNRCSECRLSGAGLSPTVAGLAARVRLPWLDPNQTHSLVRLLTTRQMTAAFWDSWQEMLELVDAIHALAAWVRDILELNGAPSEKIHLIRTGGPEPVAGDEIRVKKQSEGPGSNPHLRLAFIGRSTLIKGMHVLVEAIQRLPQDLPVHVTFFRNSSSWEQTEYGRELQHKLETDNRFEVKYNLPNDQLLKVLAGFDLCVVPSLWLETGPLVVLESFAAGVPVLGSRLGGIAELVRDGLDGLLFEPGNGAELANIIQRLVDNPKQLEKLRKGVKPPRNLIQVTEDIITLYKEMQRIYVV